MYKKIDFIIFIVVFLLTILSLPLSAWFPFEKFTNSAIEKHYLYFINSTYRSFIFAIPILVFNFIVFLFLFKKNSHYCVGVLFFCIIGSSDITDGIILLINTTNFSNPHLSTFPWPNYTEFTQYLSSISSPIHYLLMIFWALSNFYLIRYLRETSSFSK